MASRSIGNLRERLVVVSSTPPTHTLASLTSSAGVATATFSTPHGLAAGDYAVLAGASPDGYNGRFKIASVSSEVAVTFAVAVGLTTPATGTITLTYASDAQGGRRLVWRTVDTLAAQLLPIRATERLQMAAIQRITDYRFRVRWRSDLTPAMRIYWTPSGCSSVASRKTLTITGILPDEDGRSWMLIDGCEV